MKSPLGLSANALGHAMNHVAHEGMMSTPAFLMVSHRSLRTALAVAARSSADELPAQYDSTAWKRSATFEDIPPADRNSKCRRAGVETTDLFHGTSHADTGVTEDSRLDHFESV